MAPRTPHETVVRGLYLPVGAKILTSIGPPVDGIDGADYTPRGSICIAIGSSVVYVNRHTKAEPRWTLMTTLTLGPE